MSGREHLPIEDDPTSLEEAEAEGRVPIGEEPTAVQRFGTTAEEQRRGDTLAHRLLEEEPDVAGVAAPAPPPQLTAVGDASPDAEDDDADLTADVAPGDADDAPELAAMQVMDEDEVGGMTDHAERG